MGKSFIADIPEYKDRHSQLLGSFASNVASTGFYPLHAVGRESTFTGAYWTPSADQSAPGDANYRTLQVVNTGSLGSGTIVLASKVLSASAGANIRQALTNGVAANLGLSDGDVLAIRFLITSNGLVTTGGNYQVEYL